MIAVGQHLQLEKHEADAKLAESFLKLKTNPNDPAVLTDIGHAYNVQEKDDLSFEYMKRALAALEHPITWFNYALLLRQYGRHEEAFPYVEKAHKAWPWNIFMGHVYAEELIRQGKWLEAWPLCAKYRSTHHFCAIPGVAEWQGEDIRGKRLAVVCEGGNGDAIWLYRFLPKLKEMGALVRFHTTESLAALFDENRNLDYPKDTILYDLEHPYDYWVSIFELLRWLNVAEPYWPGVYIKAYPDLSLANRTALPKVGICWSAGEKLDVRKHRSLSKDHALALTSNNQIDWLNLQKDENLPVFMWKFPMKDWLDTAHCVAALDLVITVDTAMLHLAGAMGKPTWLLLGGFQDCKWQAGETTGWYPSVRIFRNDSAGFDNLIPKVQKELDAFAGNRVNL